MSPSGSEPLPGAGPHDAIPRPVLEAFGLDPAAPSRTVRGARLYDDVVLKPVDHAAEAAWCADVHDTIEVTDVRLPRPLRTPDGTAVVAGWCGWERVDGRPDPARWREVLAVAGRLHCALADQPRPVWMATKDDLWRQADRHAWNEIGPAHVTGDRGHLLRPLLDRLDGLHVSEACSSASQVIHVDLLGNVLFTDDDTPAVVDPTYYWRPAAYAEAVAAVDAAAWTTASTAPLAHVAGLGKLDVLVRAARFRLARDLLEPHGSPATLAAHARVVDWLMEHATG